MVSAQALAHLVDLIASGVYTGVIRGRGNGDDGDGAVGESDAQQRGKGTRRVYESIRIEIEDWVSGPGERGRRYNINDQGVVILEKQAVLNCRWPTQRSWCGQEREQKDQPKQGGANG